MALAVNRARSDYERATSFVSVERDYDGVRFAVDDHPGLAGPGPFFDVPLWICEIVHAPRNRSGHIEGIEISLVAAIQDVIRHGDRVAVV